MEGGLKASRRAILRQGVLSLGALAGIVGLAGAGEKARSGALTVPGLPVSSTAITMTLLGRDWHLTAPGLRRGDLPKRGDQVSVTGALSLAAGSEQVGAFYSSVVHLDSPMGHGPYATAQMETHTFVLGGGTLIGVGTTSPGADSSFAIVGGTGLYVGASGSYVARQSPLETGGDGTAHFVMTLNSGR